ncbi:general stress protein [Bacillus taeanensis]|nr:general stress protein [Bacillus taeanensis]
MKKKAAGIFENVGQAVQVIEELKVVGFTMNEISFIVKNTDDLNTISQITNIPPTSTTDQGLTAGAVSGAITGAAAAGTYGVFAGMSALAISGLGPAHAAEGVIDTVRYSAKGLASGGITGALIGLGLSSQEAVEYEGYVRDGKILVLVQTDSIREESVQDIFTANESLLSEMKRIQEKAKEALIEKHNKTNREEFLEGLR